MRTSSNITFFGFALADSMFAGNANISRRVLTPEQAKAIIAEGVEVCLNPSHQPTIEAMRSRFGIDVTIPETAPKVQLGTGDRLVVMAIRGLPRLDATRHEYTADEVAAATFEFVMYEVEKAWTLQPLEGLLSQPFAFHTLDVHNRAQENIEKKLGKITLGELLEYSEAELLRKNIGWRALFAIRKKLDELSELTGTPIKLKISGEQ